MKLVVLSMMVAIVFANGSDDEPKYGGMFWPSYQSHLLQSTKAQSLAEWYDQSDPIFVSGDYNVSNIRQNNPGDLSSWSGSYLKISKPAPSWEGTAIVNGEIKTIKSDDYLGKYLIFFFYPLDFTFVCPTEIIAFSDRAEEFRKIGAEVVACSVDSHFTHLAWTNTERKEGGLGKINIPLLSDLTHKISRDYGVLLEDLGHTLRGLFIIDPKGILRQITMNDLPVGRSVDETLRLVQAFQHTDQHGEVCPAGWQPGADTIIPDPEGKMKYFQKMREL